MKNYEKYGNEIIQLAKDSADDCAEFVVPNKYKKYGIIYPLLNNSRTNYFYLFPFFNVIISNAIISTIPYIHNIIINNTGMMICYCY